MQSLQSLTISTYLLIRHIRKYYVIDDKSKKVIREFIYYFNKHWKTYDDDTDNDMLSFSNHRQQGASDLEIRDRLMRQIFFEFLENKGYEIKEKDKNRAFSELQRIIIYRRDKGFCQECLREGKPENEAEVSWSNYQADHVVPHSAGGETVVENGELLCAYHNRSKGATIPR